MSDAERAHVVVHAADAVTTTSLEALLGSIRHVAVRTRPVARLNDPEMTEVTPSVAVFDLDHRTGDVVGLASALSAQHDAVILIGHHVPPALVRRAVGAGVQGIITKDATIGELSAIVLRVAAGGSHVCPRLASAAIRSATSPLTPRERQCLLLCHQGSSVAGIADQLHLAQGTVRNLLSAAVRKTGVAGRAAAASTARDRGWI
jgi:two-component system response regulator DesR